MSVHSYVERKAELDLRQFVARWHKFVCPPFTLDLKQYIWFSFIISIHKEDILIITYFYYIVCVFVQQSLVYHCHVTRNCQTVFTGNESTARNILTVRFSSKYVKRAKITGTIELRRVQDALKKSAWKRLGILNMRLQIGTHVTLINRFTI